MSMHARLHTLKETVRRRKHSITQLSYLYLSNAFSAVFGLILVIVLANILDPSEYGTYKYIYSVVGMISVFSLSGGFRTTIIQSAAKGFDGIVAVLHKKNPLLNLPMAIAGIAVCGYYIFKGNLLIGSSVCVLTFATILANNGLLASAYLNGRKMYKGILVSQLVISVTTVVSLLIAVATTKNIFGIIAISSLSVGLASTGLLYYIRKNIVRNDEIHDEIRAYGKHLSFLNIISTILQYIDSVLIFGTIGSTSLATYALATPFVDRILGFMKSSYFFVLPKFTEIGPKKALHALYARSLIGFGIGLGIFALYTLAIPFVFSVLFPKYLSAVNLSILFALNIPLVGLATLLQAYIDSLLEIRKKYILQGIVFTTRITSLFILIHLFGVRGVIYSELLTRIVGIIAMVVLIETSRRKQFPL